MQGKRPFGVEVNNYLGCWPQYGVSQADIIYEMETEGGITRMLALYADIREVERIGPIRSARTFIEAAMPFEPIIVHLGGSPLFDRFLQENDLRTINAGYLAGAAFLDEERHKTYAIEHCYFTSAHLIYRALSFAKIREDYSVSTPASAFNFAPKGTLASLGGGEAEQALFSFSSYADCDLRYNKTLGKYQKWQFNKKQLDAGNDNEQLAFDNAFILFMPINSVNDMILVKGDFSAGGEGVYLSRGRYEKITWKKGEPRDNYKFFTASGEELEVNRGSTYVALVRNERADKLTIDGAPV